MSSGDGPTADGFTSCPATTAKWSLAPPRRSAPTPYPPPGAALDLLRAAADLVPEITEYELVETSVGHRPGTPDNAPLLGTLRPDLVVATGHYRHGILLTPVTADAIAQLLLEGSTPDVISAFSPDSFSRREAIVITVNGQPA